MYWEDFHWHLLQDCIDPIKVCVWKVRCGAEWKWCKLEVLAGDEEGCESSLGEEMLTDCYEHHCFNKEKGKVTKWMGVWIVCSNVHRLSLGGTIFGHSVAPSRFLSDSLNTFIQPVIFFSQINPVLQTKQKSQVNCHVINTSLGYVTQHLCVECGSHKE